ncbi:hypothetical protein UlMin_008733 [Ulmus minor]
MEVVVTSMLAVFGIVNEFGREIFGKNPILIAKLGLDGPFVGVYGSNCPKWIVTMEVDTICPHIFYYKANKGHLKALKKKAKEPEVPKPKPEPTTETFIDASALKKHSHIHRERQYIFHYEGCGKKFLDSSKLKRHFLIHTREIDFVCPHEGCGKVIISLPVCTSLDFNLRSHMKMHSQENYHIYPCPDCGKRYAHEYKLKNHITAHHEKSATMEVVKYTPTSTSEKQTKAPKPTSGGAYSSASSDFPYACPYEGCEKAYIHEYKLKLFHHCPRNLLLLVQLMPWYKPKTKCK